MIRTAVTYFIQFAAAFLILGSLAWLVLVARWRFQLHREQIRIDRLARMHRGVRSCERTYGGAR